MSSKPRSKPGQKRSAAALKAAKNAFEEERSALHVYRYGPLGQALRDTLNQYISSHQLPAQLALKMIQTFEEIFHRRLVHFLIDSRINTNLKSAVALTKDDIFLKMTGSVKQFRCFDDIWTVIMNKVKFYKASEDDFAEAPCRSSLEGPGPKLRKKLPKPGKVELFFIDSASRVKLIAGASDQHRAQHPIRIGGCPAFGGGGGNAGSSPPRGTKRKKLRLVSLLPLSEPVQYSQCSDSLADIPEHLLK